MVKIYYTKKNYKHRLIRKLMSAGHWCVEVDGVFNALGGRLYGTSPLWNVKDAFIRGALEGGAYNITDVLENI